MSPDTPITKATVERFLESQGSSETHIQAVVAGYECCKNEAERHEFFKRLKAKRGGAVSAVQNKAELGESTKTQKPAEPTEPTKDPE